MHHIKKAVLLICFLVCCCLALSGTAASANDTPKKGLIISKGMNIPEFTVESLNSSNHRKYLGIKGNEPFTLSQVRADIIVLEFFSYICSHCRRQAHVLNDVYEKVKKDKQTANRIKIIAVAAASGQDQVDKWRETFKTPFPLIPDPKQKIYMKFGRPPVPCTLFVNGSGKVLAVHYGVAEDKDAFFGELMNAYKEATHESDKKNCGGN